MARPKRVPPSDSRESPAFWMKMVEASDKRRDLFNKQYAMYARALMGDLEAALDPKVRDETRQSWEPSLENMLSLVTTASMADLFFRFPRFVVRPFANSADPKFGAALARCETTMLAYKMRQCRFMEKARRALQDALLAGIGILKVTVDSEIVVDDDLVEAQKKEALEEIEGFLKRGEKIKAREDQIHSIHIQVKAPFLAQAERGEIQLPRPAVKYLRNHLRMHEAMKGSERPFETIRASSVRIRRVNPLDYGWDPTVDDRTDSSWRSHRFLLRRADVLANENYNREARLALQVSNDRWESRTYQPRVRTPGSFDIPEDMVCVTEVYDFVDQQCRLYADGGAEMLYQYPRGDLADIQTSGPFEEIAFVEDCMEGQGIPPPNSYWAEQRAATTLASTNVKAATLGIPRIIYNGREIDVAEMTAAADAKAGAYVAVNPKSAMDKALEDTFAQLPVPEIKEQALQTKADVVRGIERRSGLGGPKTGGGDFTDTATAAALVADASTSLAEDRGAKVDDWSERCGRMIHRLNRRFVPLSEWVNVCGPEAIEAVPQQFALEDVKNDLGIEIVPGSSRRRNTAVDQKQLLEGLQAFSADPLMTGPAAGKMRTQMYRMYFEDGGVTGLDWNAVEQEVVMLGAMQAMAASGGAPAPGEEGAEGAPGPDAEGTSTEPNDMMQGVANVGGGRVPTGASVGDRVREVRGGALDRAKNRV